MTSRKINFAYGVIALLLVILATPPVIAWWYRVSFWLYSTFLFWIASSFPKTISEPTQRYFRFFFIWTFTVLILTRVLPFLHWGEAPLGYDTGIYRQLFMNYVSDTATSPEAFRPLAIVVRIFSTIGLSTDTILHGVLGLLNVLLGLSLYAVSAQAFHSRLIALSTLLIFTLSIAQYEAYIWMFYRMMVSIVLLMVAMAFIIQKSWLALLPAALGGAVHPATFLVFGLSYILSILLLVVRTVRLRASWHDVLRAILLGGGMLLGAILLNASEFSFELPTLTQQKLQISNAASYLSSELSGFYLNITNFRLSTLVYTPLALIGINILWRRRHEFSKATLTQNPLFVVSFAITSIVLIAARVIFFQRYLILLDLMNILFAGVAFAYFLDYFHDLKLGRVLISVFIVGFSAIILAYSWTRSPWIPPSELQELKRANSQMEPGSFAMATDSYYTPWVYGYLSSHAVAPGYFINRWTYDEWTSFWESGTDDDRIRLLSRYSTEAPLYIFAGSKQPEYAKMIAFLNTYAVRLSDHIWRYQ